MNRYNSKKQKDGYWLSYLDSNFNKTERSNAKYYRYDYYCNGKPKVGNSHKTKRNLNTKIVYKPNFVDPINEYPILLNGDVFYYDKQDTLVGYESYKNGRPSVFKDIYCFPNHNPLKKSSLDVFYFDSACGNNLRAVLYYQIHNGIPLYKECYEAELKYFNRVYFVKHKEFKSINGVRLGYAYQSRNFFEIGYSEKYNKGVYIDSIHNKLYDNFSFPGFTVSFLASWIKNKTYFGQKFVYSYTFYLINSEVGLVNYTNLKRYDYRVILGMGPSLFGRFSFMYHYSIPLVSDPFADISKHSFSVVLY
ncbi:MAG: hypothetical protein JNL63_09265 [Bacteroidia bacterium]|nr:hypothetical protein [Bacteroidia bacterium]